ncbi:hypothetical protein PBY51_017229 [Eleginops maclovinus]|uniref:TNFR-Cys domain-containing protein n=1 Tax=Eleginops maclovinus TaxID=56733 RepID=A0AAN8AMJ8_ELEMC|nr:hypothetical protein PBY51_017229 [Eleginops maclovinus]
MQPLCNLALTFLCALSFLSSVFSLQCNDTQYAWPVDQPTLCCNKCQPGQRMRQRSPVTCENKCGPCATNRYTDTYTVMYDCEVCDKCNKPNMEYSSNCTTTHNAVCRCKAGYRCKDVTCKQCVPTPTTTTKPKPTTVLRYETLTEPWPRQIRDTAWFLVIIALLCAGLAIVVLAKMKPFLRWIKSKHGYFLAKEPAPVPARFDDEGVSTPIQEVLGKCEV